MNVELLGYYGNDESVALSAWQSTNLELGIEMPEDINERIHALYEATAKTKKKSCQELLAMLASEGHHTPFEVSTLHFQVRADISTHIQCIKHRIGVSASSESARYKELKDKWYVPEDWKDVEVLHSEDYISDDYKGYAWLWETECCRWSEALARYSELGHQLYHIACKELTSVLGRKRAKESARFFLGYNKELDFSLTFNFRSFMHFQGLRNSESAQKEIQELAQSMLTLVQDIPGNPFRYSLEAFGYGTTTP